MTILTPDFLKQGAWYSIEQAGRLLNSAVLLYDQGDWSTAAAIALLAREELGRFRILSTFARNPIEIAAPDAAKTLRKKLSDHSGKQKSAVLSVALVSAGNDPIGKAINITTNPNSTPEEVEDAMAFLHERGEDKARRLPEDRNKLRERAIYVDLNDSNNGWHRPLDIPKEKLFNEINHTANDYLNQRRYLMDPAVGQNFQDMARVLESLNPRPTLVEARFPKYP